MAELQEIRRFLVEVSRRASHVGHEAEDLAHDLVLSALRRGWPLDGDAFVRSARRAARLHAAFVARSAVRRRAREASIVTEEVGGFADAVEPAAGSASPVLPQALQTTLYLLLQGLEKAELRSVLGLTDAALRKRFQALRGHAPLTRPDIPHSSASAQRQEVRRSQVTLLPPLAGRLASDQRARRVLATADPDGHGIIFAELLTKGRGAATTSTLAPKVGRRKEEMPCSTASSRTSRSSSS